MNCPGGVTSLDILKNGSTISVGTANGYLLMYDLRNTDNGPYLSVKAHDSSVYCVKFIQPQSREKLTVINNNLQVANDNSMRRSNSYNNEIINRWFFFCYFNWLLLFLVNLFLFIAKINYNIYSPEPINHNHANINSSTSSESTGQTITFQNNQDSGLLKYFYLLFSSLNK